MQQTSLLGATLRLGAVLALAAQASAGVIRIAERPALGAFSSLQAAVDAAPEGGLLLIGTGVYAPATIDGKSVSLVEVPGSVARVTGTLTVKNLAPAQLVLLSGLELRGGGSALELVDSAGQVRLHGCTLEGGHVPGPFAFQDGAPAVTALRCARVLFAGCTIEGGDAQSDPGGPGPSGGTGIDGRDSTVALYDSTVRGGSGGVEGCVGGLGGDACRFVGRGVLAFGSTLRGGAGGSGDALNCCDGGDGGDALELLTAQAQLLDTQTLPGAGGPSGCGIAGNAGLAVRAVGSPVAVLPGIRRKLSGATLSSDRATLQLLVEGEAGDRLFLVPSATAGFAFDPALHGVWTGSATNAPALAPLATLGAGGALALRLPVGDWTPGVAHRALHLQVVCLDAAGKPRLSSPLAVELLERDGGRDCDGDGLNDFVGLLEQPGNDCNQNLLPDACDLAAGLEQDCDGNALPDSCEIAAGLVPDCDGNGVPDPCDLASGAAADCNANGVLDACDIAAGASLDTNGNGIPDECEAHTPQIVWVDAAAAPGGNGSAARPFATIRAGIDASFHGDTVMLRDGVYVGPENRDLDPNGRAIVIRSEHGPAACVIDCQAAGRAFSIVSGEGPECRIQGLTIRNGTSVAAPHHDEHGGGIYVGVASPTISGCVIEDCFARFGGGIAAVSRPLRVEDCVFRRCNTLAIAYFTSGGGGIFGGFTVAPGGVLPAIVGCEFSECNSDAGGAIRVDASVRTVISHCRFLGNLSSGPGGAIHAQSTNSNGQPVFLVQDCLMLGNSAVRAGAIYAQSSFCCTTSPVLAVESCTMVFNSAVQEAGAIYLQTSPFGGPPLEVRNCVLWDNTATTGNVLVQAGGATTVSVLACDVLGGPSSFVVGANSTLAWGGDNLDVDPRFEDPDGPDNLLSTLHDDDFSLGATSPCIDAGDNGLISPDFADVDGDGDVLEPVPLDLAKNPRFAEVPSVPNTGQGQAPFVDLGAYERRP